MNYETARKLLIAQTVTTEENPDALLMRMKLGKTTSTRSDHFDFISFEGGI